MHTADSVTDSDSRTSLRRPTILAAMNALTGVTTVGSGTATAQQGGGRVETRGCGNENLTPEEGDNATPGDGEETETGLEDDSDSEDEQPEAPSG